MTTTYSPISRKHHVPARTRWHFVLRHTLYWPDHSAAFTDIYKHKGNPEGFEEFLKEVPESVLNQMRESDFQRQLDSPEGW
ncbi:uncharacterized protein YALI1_A03599g [Yarrowia lipolytica]|uniref:Uncharacterized protein n=1 Tax=Yarrowia lipolytica TaxID=4952 RepID=A0A1D8N3M5_YARLL|nr:hypothetical protein YALI1_A03599g [Yarrowia lipolytica]